MSGQANLPAGIIGGFGLSCGASCLALHAQEQVTMERLTALLNGIGVEISKRQIVRLLAEPLNDRVAEDQMAFDAGSRNPSKVPTHHPAPDRSIV